MVGNATENHGFGAFDTFMVLSIVLPSDGIKRNPDMDQMGLSAGNRLQSKILPLRVAFHSVTLNAFSFQEIHRWRPLVIDH